MERDWLKAYFTEPAQRALFFSRYEAAKAGAKVVDAEHLLLGIIREREPALDEFLKLNQIRLREIWRQLERLNPIAGPPEVPDLAFSHSVEQIFQHAASYHDPENPANTFDLLIEILRAPHSKAHEVLGNVGITLDVIRDYRAWLGARPYLDISRESQ